MAVKHRVRLNDCVWVCGVATDPIARFRSLKQVLAARGVPLFALKDHTDRDGLQKLHTMTRQSDKHVVLHGLGGKELNAVYPFFKERKNFSLVLNDWWNSTYWFNQNAEYLFFHNYNGIVVRRKLAAFADTRNAPWASLPESTVWYELVCTLLRLPAIAVAPLLNAWKWVQRRGDPVPPERLLYFPFPVVAEDVPLIEEPLEYDFSHVSSTGGYWLMRDAYASANLNFVNLYCDRKRLIDMIRVFENRPFKIYDRRHDPRYLPWEKFSRIIRQSRFVIATGGLHHNSVPKFMENVCLGTPILGSGLPFEFPWLDRCLFTIDASRTTPSELKPKLQEALEQYPVLRANCLTARETVLKLYEAGRLLDVLQDQIDGKSIPPGYLKNVPC